MTKSKASGVKHRSPIRIIHLSKAAQKKKKKTTRLSTASRWVPHARKRIKREKEGENKGRVGREKQHGERDTKAECKRDTNESVCAITDEDTTCVCGGLQSSEGRPLSSV